jgi:hypothetical protein
MRNQHQYSSKQHHYNSHQQQHHSPTFERCKSVCRSFFLSLFLLFYIYHIQMLYNIFFEFCFRWLIFFIFLFLNTTIWHFCNNSKSETNLSHFVLFFFFLIQLVKIYLIWVFFSWFKILFKNTFKKSTIVSLSQMKFKWK